MIHGLYLHIPFCARRCYYCDFNTYEGQENLIPNYVEALLKDMEQSKALASPTGLQSIFFGGGTPSLLEPRHIKTLLEKARSIFGNSPDLEITLEANPGTISVAQFEGYRAAGVNRLSLGFQAYQDHHLKALGRIHNAAESAQAFHMARQAGFDNISVDLMFGLSNQTMEEWQQSLTWAADLQPEHVSFYGLTIEQGTRFFALSEQGKLPLPEEELQAQMYEWGIAFLASRGLQQYEISNFSKAGRRSRHNQLYWLNKDTLGLGAGAWSYVNGRRYKRIRSPQGYIDGAAKGAVPEEESERLEPNQARGEAAYLNLRLLDGVDLADWKQRTGHDWDQEFGPQTEKFTSLGLLKMEAGRLKLTAKGLPLANEVFSSLV